MGARIGLFFLCSVFFMASFVGSGSLPGRTARTTTTVFLVETIDPAIFDPSHISIVNFSDPEAALIRQSLLSKFTGRCEEEFIRAGLMSPWELAWGAGIVIQYSRDLYVEQTEALGLVYDATRAKYQVEFGTGRAQAGTVPFVRYGLVLTTDGKPHIFLHGSAFVGESFWLNTLSLSDVLTHELIHAGGQPPTPGRLGFLRHDLAGFEHYEDIMEACR